MIIVEDRSLMFFFLVVVRVRPLSDGSNPWSTSLVKSQKSVPLAALFADQGEMEIECYAACFNHMEHFWVLAGAHFFSVCDVQL